jgi:hypothetical protein
LAALHDSQPANEEPKDNKSDNGGDAHAIGSHSLLGENRSRNQKNRKEQKTHRIEALETLNTSFKNREFLLLDFVKVLFSDGQFLFLARVVRKMAMFVSDGNSSYLVKGFNRAAKVSIVLALLKKRVRVRGVTPGGRSSNAAVVLNGVATTRTEDTIQMREEKKKSQISILHRG